MQKIEIIVPSKIGEEFEIGTEVYRLESIELNERGTFYIAYNNGTKKKCKFTLTVGLVPVKATVIPFQAIKIDLKREA